MMTYQLVVCRVSHPVMCSFMDTGLSFCYLLFLVVLCLCECVCASASLVFTYRYNLSDSIMFISSRLVIFSNFYYINCSINKLVLLYSSLNIVVHLLRTNVQQKYHTIISLSADYYIL